MSQEKLSKAIRIAVATILFGLLVVLIVLTIKISHANGDHIKSIGKNWSSRPITNIDAGKECALDTEPLLTGEWPGTINGCDCGEGDLTRNTCDARNVGDSDIGSIYLELACDDIPAKPPVPYKFWRGQFLCSRRTLPSYLKLTIAKSKEECEAGTRSCGKVDSLFNVLCVKKSKPCPINEIEFIGPGDKPPKGKSWDVMELNGAKLIATNQSSNKEILIQLENSDNLPCANPYYKPYKVKPYILNPYFNSRYYCHSNEGPVEDNRFKLVDSYSYSNLQIENGITKITSQLPYYKNRSYFTNLYQRNYIGLEISCRKELLEKGDLENFISNMLDFKYNKKVSLILLIITVIFLGVELGLYIFSILEEEYKVYTYIGHLISIVLFAVGVSYIDWHVAEYEILARKECVDTITYFVAKDFYSNMKTIHALSTTGIVLFILSSLAEIPTFFF